MVVVAVLAAFLIYKNMLPYFVWSEAAYGYHWTYRLPLIAHVTGGLTDLGQRRRDVRQGPDGLVYLLTEETAGAMLRVEPAR